MPAEGTLEPADAELLRCAAAGDREAFERLLVRHEAAVHRYLSVLSRDPDRVEDALQETFIAAWRGAASFHGAGSARAWLLTIARHALQRQFRRRAGEPARLEPLHGLAEAAGWGEADPGWAERFEARDLVERALRRLPAEDREVIVLRDLEGFSGEEVARMLDLTLAAAKSRLHRARVRLMAELRGGGHEA